MGLTVREESYYVLEKTCFEYHARIERLVAALEECMKHVPAHVEERYRHLLSE